jgi:dihydropteroate synthase
MCLDAGIEANRLIADPGMGAFLSNDPEVSWVVAENFGQLPYPAGGLLLGCSRKGFLKVLGDMDRDAKDLYSAQIGVAAIRQVPQGVTTYLRVHNVAGQREALSSPPVSFPDWRAAKGR